MQQQIDEGNYVIEKRKVKTLTARQTPQKVNHPAKTNGYRHG